jgi:hypothetical protein
MFANIAFSPWISSSERFSAMTYSIITFAIRREAQSDPPNGLL